MSASLKKTKTLLILGVMLYSGQAFAQTWWDTTYGKRLPVTVTTGSSMPDKGYQGYTARLATLDTASLIGASELQADCDDLRLVYWNGSTNTEIPRHLINCNSATSDIRFSLQVAQTASSSDSGYYFYYDNASASSPPAVTATNVYLWYDDGSTNLLASYDQGRGDPWHGVAWQDSFAHDTNGYYTYDNGDNYTDSFRVPVDERDVYVEAEFFHTGCYPLNMTTGVIARGITASGTGGSESSDHYYATSRGHNTSCGAGYSNDGDIVKQTRSGTVVDGVNPAAIATNVWRRQGLAVSSVNPTNLSYYDNDSSAAWGALGYPTAGSLHVAGTDASDLEGRGYAGIMTSQDAGRVRNILIRRYVATEPTVSIGTVEMVNPSIQVTKVADKTVNVAVGETITYTYTVTNNGNTVINAIDLVDSHNGSGTLPDPSNESILADNGVPGDSSDGTPNNGIWDILGVGDQITFSTQYVVTQSDIDNLQ